MSKDNIQKKKPVTLTPALIADMDIVPFMTMCQKENVTNVGVIRSLCEMAIGEVQHTFVQISVHANKMYDTRAVTDAPEDFDALIKQVASLGTLLGMLNTKLQIAQYHYTELTPDCFKKGDK